jgi:hypothetical protein
MYSEQNGQVTLTMSREDYEQLLEVFGIATVAGTHAKWQLNVKVAELLNRLNQGNPNYKPYQVKETP